MKKQFYFKPIKLRIDRGSSKYAVTENLHPVFSWGAVHSENCQYQSEFNLSFYCDGEEIHNTGWVKSKNQEYIYDGTPFKNGSRISWSVTLRDKNGVTSTTETESFIYSDPAKLNAKWIRKNNAENRRAVFFTKNFSLNKSVKRAILSTCGLGYHTAFINGTETNEFVMQPPVTIYNKQVYYTVDEITPEMLNSGENVIGIILADGWRSNYGFWCEALLRDRDVPFIGDTALFAQLDIYYEDGTSESVVTDKSWLCADSNIESNLFDGETYDARAKIEGWNINGLNSENAQYADVIESPTEKLHPQNFEAIKYQKEYSPISIIRSEDGFLCDFGYNMAGVCRIIIPRGKASGEKVVIRHAERLDNEHKLFPDTLRRAKSEDTYIYNGNETEDLKWMPKFTYHGFRYVHVSGIDYLTEDMICAVSVYNDIESKSYFKCGNPVVNAIYEAARQTERNNIHHIFTDCPQRDERMAWMNDAAVRFDHIPYNFDIGRMFPKIIRDEIAEQSDDGAITCTAPLLYGYRPADPVCCAYIIAGMRACMHTGNKEIIAEAYPSYKSWNNYLKNLRGEDGILYHSHFGDWAAPVAGCIAPENARSAVTPNEVMSTAIHYLIYKYLAEFAAILGNGEEEINLKEADCVKQAFTKKYVDITTGNVSTGSMGCLTIALKTGILDEDVSLKSAELLHNELISKNYSFTTGNINTKYIYDVLTDYGYKKDAWKLISKTDYPSLGFMLANGATSIWERFEDKENSEMNSHDHPMYGAVGSWLYEYVAGIRNPENGFESFTIEPCFPDGLRFAEARVDTVKGDIIVSWTNKNGVVNIFFTVPFGSKAKFIIKGTEKVYESGNYSLAVEHLNFI